MDKSEIEKRAKKYANKVSKTWRDKECASVDFTAGAIEISNAQIDQAIRDLSINHSWIGKPQLLEELQHELESLKIH